MAWQGPNTSIKMRGRSRDRESERGRGSEEKNGKKCSASLAGSFNSCASACDCFMGFGWTQRLTGSLLVLCCAWWHVPRATWRLVNYAKLAAALHKLIVECFRIPLWVQLLIVERRKSEEICYFCLFCSILSGGFVKCNSNLIRCILNSLQLTCLKGF